MAAKDHGKKFRSKLAASFSGIVHVELEPAVQFEQEVSPNSLLSQCIVTAR